MEAKYGEPFERIGPWGSIPDRNTRHILVSCRSLPRAEIVVAIYGNGKDQTYRDNFMEHYFKEQTVEFINNVAKDFFDDFTFDIDIPHMVLSDEITPTTEFEEYIRKNLIFVKIKIDDSDEETLRAFLNTLISQEIRFSFGIDILSINEGFTAQYLTKHFDLEDDEKLHLRSTGELRRW
jgi:hypothetical protein